MYCGSSMHQLEEDLKSVFNEEGRPRWKCERPESITDKLFLSRVIHDLINGYHGCLQSVSSFSIFPSNTLDTYFQTFPLKIVPCSSIVACKALNSFGTLFRKWVNTGRAEPRQYSPPLAERVSSKPLPPTCFIPRKPYFFISPRPSVQYLHLLLSFSPTHDLISSVGVRDNSLLT
jgi:hypothetical protein